MSAHSERRHGERKELETRIYTDLYASGRENSDPDFRAIFLRRSEEAFQSRLLTLSKGKQVLEIGCGTGQHSLLAGTVAASVVGIDITEKAIEIARARAASEGLSTKVQFFVMDAEKLEFPDNAFDVIIDHESFSSLNLQAILSEVQRVLSPLGILLAIEALGNNPLFNLNRLIGAAVGKRTRWAARHIIRKKDLIGLRDTFSEVEVLPFHLLIMAAGVLRGVPLRIKRSIEQVISPIDNFLLRSILRWSAFKVVFEARYPRKDRISPDEKSSPSSS